MPTPERGITRPGEPVRMPATGRVCRDMAGPEWCERPVFSRGLCRSHYRQVARGQQLDTVEPRRGTPSGQGRYGLVDVDDDGRLLCHDCGRWYVALGVHIGMTHSPVRDYRLRHGLMMSQPLTGAGLRRTLAEHAGRPEAVARIARARHPRDALAAADPEMIRRGQRLRRG